MLLISESISPHTIAQKLGFTQPCRSADAELIQQHIKGDIFGKMSSLDEIRSIDKAYRSEKQNCSKIIAHIGSDTKSDPLT